jgi:hypothetical protein
MGQVLFRTCKSRCKRRGFVQLVAICHERSVMFAFVEDDLPAVFCAELSWKIPVFRHG